MAGSRSTILVVMGVSGSGKTTVGMRLADRLGWPFREGDDLHPPANVAKLRAGIPLGDADRAPWLEAVGRWIDDRRTCRGSGVITCSALKRAYRRALSRGRPEVRFIYLKADTALASHRMISRRGHFMPVFLLDSQFEALEPPTPDEGVVVIDASQAVEAQVDRIIQWFGEDSLRS